MRYRAQERPLSRLELSAWRMGWRHGFAGRPPQSHALEAAYAGGYEAGAADREHGRVRLVLRLAYPPA